MARKETDWHVATNLGQSPGSQGTLFSGGTKWSSDDRFPRGYTPERLHEVNDAFRMKDWGDSTPGDFAQQRSALVDTVARSTVPTEHLEDLRFMHVPPGTRILGKGHMGSTDPEGDAAGAYFRREEKVDGFSGSIAVHKEFAREKTPIHEIGHHVDRQAKISRTTGEAEGFADNYAQEHYRDRRRNPIQVEAYGGGMFGGQIRRSDQFWSDYNRTRDWGRSQAVEDDDREYFKRYPEEQLGKDDTYNPPLIKKEFVSMREPKRTPEIEINPDARPT